MADAIGSRIFTRYEAGRSLYMPDSPLVFGGRQGSYIFEHQKIATAGHTPSHIFDDHIFMLPLGETAVPFHSRLNGRPVHGHIAPGHFRFVSAGDSLSTTWEAPVEGIFVTLNQAFMFTALGDESLNMPLELVSDVMPHEDEVLANLTLTLKSYLEAGRQAGRIFEHSLLTAIAAHIFSAYGQGVRAPKGASPMTRRTRARVEDYVRQNLGRDLSLAEIATAVRMSPRQLSRSFRAATGQSLWQFVIGCRVQEATRMLARKPAPSLSYVAHVCGFESYSQFIAAFRKIFGQTPSEYRRSRS
ncbi:MAG TPA: AraC family transcriptional regulator [Gammaproteobacteria bacterium]|nr:AraC family transcriptional regulator [Gammaproteobacteria bacterium]